MAGQFDTFDLSRIIGAAEQIKAARRQEGSDRIRDQYVQGQMSRMQGVEQRESQQFTDEQRLGNTHALVRAAQSVIDSDDPVGQAHAVTEQLREHGIYNADLSQLDGAAPETYRAKARELIQHFSPFLAPQKPADVQVEQVVGPDGTPRFVSRQDAIGQQPFQKDSQPSSYEEFTRAQKDPAFGKFLQERRGKGMSVTLPDGTVIAEGSTPQSVRPGELAKPLVNSLQETIVNSTARLDRLNATLSTYRPEFLRAKGLANAATTRVKDFIGMGVSPEQQKYLNDYTEFQSNAATDLSQFLKEMSGAAVTPQEFARVEKTLPSGKELSPTEFEAKSKVALRTINRALMRANWALKNGIGVQSIEQLSKVMPLEGIDQVYEQRANAIWQEMGGTPESRATAIQRANQEFGVAR